MKKTVKKALLTTFATVLVCSATTLVGANALKASAADDTTAAITEFTMLADPTIRATTAGNAADNGIRFTAEVNATQFEALDDNGATVTTGTFIMPYDYIAGVAKAEKLDKSHFFGETAVFTWDGKTDGNGTEILHVAATPVQGTDVYKINGSVVNMHNVNLDREYIGVAYIAVDDGTTTEYYLAETDEAANKRSALQVAQNVLLESATGIEATVATNYIQKYIDWYKTETGAYPTRTLTTEYYVDSSEGYSKSNTFSKTEEIVLDEVADFTATYVSETPTLDGYTYAKGAMGNVTATTLSVDNGGTVKYYFDKNRDNVIFDGATMTMAEVANSVDHTTVDADVVLRNFSAPNAATGNPGLVIEEGWGYHGDKSIKMRSPGAGGDWANIHLHNAITFPATSKFSFVVRAGYQVDTYSEIDAYIYDQNNNYHQFKIPRVGEEYQVNQVTVDIGTAITSVTRIEIFTGITHEFFIDYICAENELYSTSSNIFVEKDQTSVEIDIVNNLASTVYSDEELASAEIKITTATYTTLATGAVENLTFTDGKATFAVAENTDYQVNYTITIGEKSVSGSFYVFGYYENMIADFDTHGANWTEKVMNSAGTYGYAYDKDGEVRTGAGIDGGNAYYIKDYATNWAGVYTDKSITLSAGENTLCMYIYCPAEGGRTYDPTGDVIEFFDGANWPGGTLASTSLKYGWNYIEVTVNNNTGSDYVCNNFIIKTNAALIGCYIDRIALK